MSACNSFLGLSDQLGYVQCSYCATLLLVSVPCSSLMNVVTVKCGHCTCLLSVSLVRASLVPLQLLASLGDGVEMEEQGFGDALPRACSHDREGVEEEEEEEEEEEGEGKGSNFPVTPTVNVNKPPEKRQRAPSAYNRFIKEEIQRIKAREPNITHKEAFSTAAKNWAHLPRIQHRGKGENCSMTLEGKKARLNEDANQVGGRRQSFHERTASRHSMQAATTPLDGQEYKV